MQWHHVVLMRAELKKPVLLWIADHVNGIATSFDGCDRLT